MSEGYNASRGAVRCDECERMWMHGARGQIPRFISNSGSYGQRFDPSHMHVESQFLMVRKLMADDSRVGRADAVVR